jgi:hypothetical protein
MTNSLIVLALSLLITLNVYAGEFTSKLLPPFCAMTEMMQEIETIIYKHVEQEKSLPYADTNDDGKADKPATQGFLPWLDFGLKEKPVDVSGKPFHYFSPRNDDLVEDDDYIVEAGVLAVFMGRESETTTKFIRSVIRIQKTDYMDDIRYRLKRCRGYVEMDKLE